VAQFVPPVDSPTSGVDWSSIRTEFVALDSAFSDEMELDDRPMDQPLDFESLLTGSHPFVEKARAYITRLGMSQDSSQIGHAFINGKYFEMDDVRCRRLRRLDT
jgi:hypothetical protein